MICRVSQKHAIGQKGSETFVKPVFPEGVILECPASLNQGTKLWVILHEGGREFYGKSDFDFNTVLNEFCCGERWISPKGTVAVFIQNKV